MTDVGAPPAGRAPVREWWPSPFGPEDELGMLNHVTDAKRREARR